MKRRAFSIQQARRLAAFTLIELLVVISIIITIVAITLPSFTTIIQSSNYTSAINQTAAALGSARILAIEKRKRTAVAFLYDVRSEQYTISVLEEDQPGADAKLSTLDGSRSEPLLVMRPAPNTTPIVLPKGTAVFGLSFAHVPDPLLPNPTGQFIPEPLIDDFTWHWYAGERYEIGVQIVENPWIFPRSDPLLFWEDGVAIAGGQDLPGPWNVLIDSGQTAEVRDALRHANSFMVLFRADGSVFSPSGEGDALEPVNAYIEHPLQPIDRDGLTADETPYDDPIAFDPELDPFTATYTDPAGVVQSVVQGERNPEVLLRPVSQLAVVDLTALRRGTGVRAPWLVHPSTSAAPWPEYDPDGRPGSGDEVPADDARLDGLVSEVSAWIDENAEIIGFDRYTGAAIRRVGQ